MNKAIIYASILLILMPFSFGLIINEVMYDPDACKDEDLEWLELYNDENLSVDLTNWFLDKEVFPNISLQPHTYLVIAKKLVSIENCSFESIYGNNDSIWNESDGFLAIELVGISFRNTNGDSIILNNSDGIIDNFSYTQNMAHPGHSIELVDGTKIESKNAGGSPGRVNEAIITYENDTSPECETPKIAISINQTNYSLQENLIINGNIACFLQNESYNLTIKIARDEDPANDTDWTYLWYVLDEEVITNISEANFTELFGNATIFIIPPNSIRGDYKILATLEYYKNDTDTTRDYEDAYFFLDGLDDLGKEILKMKKVPEIMSFGNAELIVAEFDANNYDNKKINIVSYIYSPSWISNDLEGSTLRTKPYESSAAFELEVNRGENISFAIPLFLKDNCENQYSEGTYLGKIKAYNGADEILSQNFNLTVKDNNQALCKPTPETSSAKSCSSASAYVPTASSADDSESFNYDKIRFEIDAPQIIDSEEFELKISAKNNDTVKKAFMVKAYVFQSKKAISDKDESIEVNLNIGESETVSLKIRINPEEIEDKDYKLMIKINSSALKTEKSISYPIKIDIEPPNQILMNLTEQGHEFSCENDNGKLCIETETDYSETECSKKIVKRIESPAIVYVKSNENKILDYEIIKTNLTKRGSTKLEEMNGNQEETPKSSEQNMISGEVTKIVYLSSGEKLKKLINYLVLSSLVLAIILQRGQNHGQETDKKQD